MTYVVNKKVEDLQLDFDKDDDNDPFYRPPSCVFHSESSVSIGKNCTNKIIYPECITIAIE